MLVWFSKRNRQQYRTEAVVFWQFLDGFGCIKYARFTVGEKLQTEPENGNICGLFGKVTVFCAISKIAFVFYFFSCHSKLVL